jgi:hypothetical protein
MSAKRFLLGIQELSNERIADLKDAEQLAKTGQQTRWIQGLIKLNEQWLSVATVRLEELIKYEQSDVYKMKLKSSTFRGNDDE